MTEQDTTARNRWLTLTLTRLAGSAGAVFGVVLLGRAQTMGPKILGVAIVLAALAMIAIVPRSLARRWRTPPEA
jgi:zinc transporter ZupT